MKNIWIILFSGGVLYGCTDDHSTPIVVSKNAASSSLIPSGLLTADTACWCTSAVASTGYDDNLTSEYYKAENKRGRIVRVNFSKEGLFRLLLHEKRNPFSGTETMSTLEGSVEFKKSKTGRNIVVTHPEKGCFYELSDSSCHVYPIIDELLSGYYVAHYWWEVISFFGIPSADFLLLVDIDIHPEADSNLKGKIEKSWISKFYARKVNPWDIK